MNNNIKGIYFKLLNCLIFPVMSLVLVHLTNSIDLKQVFFLQLFLGTILSFVLLKLFRIKFEFPTTFKEFLYYIARAVLNLAALFLWIKSISHFGINEATAISYSGPLWLSLLAVIFLKERFSLSILVLFTLNLIGMFVALQPKLLNLNFLPLIYALGAIIMWSIYEFICKLQTVNQHYLQQTFIFMLFSSILLLPFVVNDWQHFPSQLILHLLTVSILAVANVSVIFIAYSLAPLLLLAPFSYARIVFTVILAAIYLHEVPTIHVFVGSAIILVANLSYLYSKTSKVN